MLERGGRRRAFTLIELLVVISILSILMGLLVGGIVVVREKIRYGVAKTEISAIGQALESYHREMHTFPPDTGDWGQGDQYDPESILKYLARAVKKKSGREIGPYLHLQDEKFENGKLVDPWGNPYEFDAMHMQGGKKVGEPYLASTPEDERIRKYKIISRGSDGETDPSYPFDFSGTPDPATEDDVQSW